MLVASIGNRATDRGTSVSAPVELQSNSQAVGTSRRTQTYHDGTNLQVLKYLRRITPRDCLTVEPTALGASEAGTRRVDHSLERYRPISRPFHEAAKQHVALNRPVRRAPPQPCIDLLISLCNHNTVSGTKGLPGRNQWGRLIERLQSAMHAPHVMGTPAGGGHVSVSSACGSTTGNTAGSSVTSAITKMKPVSALPIRRSWRSRSLNIWR
jgi:hypothetical protein